mgnify:CR=1 FL=1
MFVDTHVQRYIQGHVARRLDFQVISSHAKAFQVSAERTFERCIHRSGIETIRGDEHGVPAPGPTKARR